LDRRARSFGGDLHAWCIDTALGTCYWIGCVAGQVPLAEACTLGVLTLHLVPATGFSLDLILDRRASPFGEGLHAWCIDTALGTCYWIWFGIAGQDLLAETCTLGVLTLHRVPATGFGLGSQGKLFSRRLAGLVY